MTTTLLNAGLLYESCLMYRETGMNREKIYFLQRTFVLFFTNSIEFTFYALQ